MAGMSDDAINRAIAGFKGVEHRLELVGEWRGVRWYNDPKATNPDAGRGARTSFPGTPLVLIAAGSGPGLEPPGGGKARPSHRARAGRMGPHADPLGET